MHLNFTSIRWGTILRSLAISTESFKSDRLAPRLFRSIAIALLVAIVWGFSGVIWGISPVWAKDNTVNYTLTELKYRDFSNRDLEGSAFAGANMLGINFHGANLKGAIFTKGSLIDADLSEADLSESFADRVLFDRANLTNTIFTDAIATSSSFASAEIAGADFSGTILDRYQISLMCKRASGVNPITGISTRDSLGCR
ncbi:MAG: pentapeptide repeat-containing protein [Cyanobacteriota bacterium]|nr:pentapeptide repeat-containing protein [Cyanobacteriota bacterium]